MSYNKKKQLLTFAYHSRILITELEVSLRIPKNSQAFLLNIDLPKASAVAPEASLRFPARCK